MSQTLYEQDFYAWSNRQAELFKAKKFDQLDWKNLSEEIEDMGVRQRRELENRLIELIMHLLKWKYQPTRRGRSWLNSIKNQRLDIEYLLEDYPSLKNEIDNLIVKKYKRAKSKAELETDLKVFPVECEWTQHQILDNEFFPN